MTIATQRRVVTRQSREQRETAIMQAAQRVFAEKGYEDAAMSEIAALAGVVEGTIYKYFESKRDLLFRVMAAWYEGLLRDYDIGIAGIQGTRNRLRYIVWRHLRTIHDEPALCRLFYSQIRTAGDYHASYIQDLNRRYTRFTVRLLKEGMAAGEIRPDVNVALVRDLIYGTIEHHCWNYLRGQGDLDVDRLADELVDLVLPGVAQARPTAELETNVARLGRLVERLERASKGEGEA